MHTTVLDEPPPAHLRQLTHVTGRSNVASLVRMRTHWFDRNRFFRWLDVRITVVDPPIPDMQTLAELSDVSHSALSNWRSGKYKPTLATVAKLAGPLQCAKEVVWAEAGFEVGAPVDVGEDAEIIDLIRGSKVLTPAKKDALIRIHLEEARREREERLRRVREAINLMEQP